MIHFVFSALCGVLSLGFSVAVSAASCSPSTASTASTAGTAGTAGTAHAASTLHPDTSESGQSLVVEYGWKSSYRPGLGRLTVYLLKDRQTVLLSEDSNTCALNPTGHPVACTDKEINKKIVSLHYDGQSFDHQFVFHLAETPYDLVIGGPYPVLLRLDEKKKIVEIIPLNPVVRVQSLQFGDTDSSDD